MLQPRRRVVSSTLAVAMVVALAHSCGAARAAADSPAVVIDRSPDPATVYVACPSVAILPDGTFVASHSWFGTGTLVNGAGLPAGPFSTTAEFQ